MATFEPKAGFERVTIAVPGMDESLVIDGPYETDDAGVISALDANAQLKRSRGTRSSGDSADSNQPEVISNKPYVEGEDK